MSRRAAIAHQQSLDADDSGEDANHGEEVDEKLAVRRAKNREAARRVRERRMNQIKTLSEQVAALQLENERLKSLNARNLPQQGGQPSTAPDGAPSDHSHSANHTATPTQSQTQHRRSVDRDDHKSHADPGTPSDGSRTSDNACTNEAGVQTDVTMVAQDWSPRDIMQVMTLLTRSSMPDGLADLQQQQQQQPQQQPLTPQLQQQLEQLQQQQQQQQQQTQAQKQQQQQAQKAHEQQQQQQRPRPQAVQQQSSGLSPAASPASAVSSVRGANDQGQQTAQLPVPNAPFTLEQVQALLEMNSKLLGAQQQAMAGGTPAANASASLPAPALQQMQHKRAAPSAPSPSSSTGMASGPTQLRVQQQVPQAVLKQEPLQAPPRQATWQDLKALRGTDSISMVPWSQASNGPMGPSAVAAAQAAAALAAQGRSGSGGAGRTGSGQGENSASFAPQLQNLYNSTLPADMRAFNRSAGLLFSLDDNEATLMSTDGNLLSDMNLGLTSDMNLASEELLRHVPLPEDAAALGHTAWL